MRLEPYGTSQDKEGDFLFYSCLKFLPQISTADTVNGLYGLSAVMTAGEGE